MAVSMWGLLRALLASLAFGALLHVLYDGIRVLRALGGERFGSRLAERLYACRLPGLSSRVGARPAHRAGRRMRCILLFITDLLFMLAAGLLFALFVYWQNDGELRAVLLLGVAIGFAAWHVTVGRLTVAAGEAVAFFLHALLAYLFLCIRVPAVLVARFAMRAAGWLFSRLCRLLAFLYMHLFLARSSRRAEKRSLQRTFADLPPRS